MNWWVLAAGVFAVFTVAGHFTVGSKQFLKPTLEAEFDPVARKVMHCVFHYVSVFLILSALGLLAVGAGGNLGGGEALLVRFIALNYLLFAVWQIAIALGSDLPNPLMKLFQWVFFAAIGVLALIGVYGPGV